MSSKAFNVCSYDWFSRLFTSLAVLFWIFQAMLCLFEDKDSVFACSICLSLFVRVFICLHNHSKYVQISWSLSWMEIEHSLWQILNYWVFCSYDCYCPTATILPISLFIVPALPFPVHPRLLRVLQRLDFGRVSKCFELQRLKSGPGSYHNHACALASGNSWWTKLCWLICCF